MKPTSEQEQIVAAKGRVIVANAFAGTGKSSTLRILAESQPRKKFIYIAFNKAIQLAAEASFPKNVTCKTGHSLAYAKFGFKYQNSGTLAPDIKPNQIMGVLRTGSLPKTIHRLYAARVLESVKLFMSSDKAKLNQIVLGNSPAEQMINDVALRDDARNVWQMMCDSKLPMTHDGYLKLYQLSTPALNYDTCLFDEFQDQTPAMQSIISSQKNSRLYYVGDRHQSIYAFRGAVNAMDSIKADERFYLTGSFRFGSEVADVANRILRMKRETQTLRGFGNPGQVIPATTKVGHAKEGHTVISRGNSALFEAAIVAMDNNRPLAFVGEIKGYRLDQISDVYSLSKGNNSAIRDPFIASFQTYHDMVEYAEELNDVDLKSRSKLVKQYRDSIPGLIDSIYKTAMVYSPDTPKDACVLTTAHKSKGLEFNRVIMADDFSDMLTDGPVPELDFEWAKEEPEEVNVIYVAATRARKVLELPEKLEKYLEVTKELDCEASERQRIKEASNNQVLKRCA